jgi:hypothetical protein
MNTYLKNLPRYENEGLRRRASRSLLTKRSHGLFEFKLAMVRVPAARRATHRGGWVVIDLFLCRESP